jgi:hypothetical protein
MAERGGLAENLDSENPLVKLIKSPMDTMKENSERGHSNGRITNADELKAQPWFAGFEDRLDSAVAATKELYAAS